MALEGEGGRKPRIAARTVAAALVLAGALSLSPARAEVPADLFVMAMRIDDVISLDPAETFEFTGAEVSANIYERLLYFANDDAPRIATIFTRSRAGAWPRTGAATPSTSAPA